MLNTNNKAHTCTSAGTKGNSLFTHTDQKCMFMYSPNNSLEMANESKTFILENVVRGHHVYKSIWTPRIRQTLNTLHETENPEDRHAVALQRSSEGTSTMVGHMPRDIILFRVAWFFLKNGGLISCEIIGRRKRSTVPGKGLEVPCTYKFTGKPTMIKKLIKLLVKP